MLQHDALLGIVIKNIHCFISVRFPQRASIQVVGKLAKKAPCFTAFAERLTHRSGITVAAADKIDAARDIFAFATW